MAYVRPYGKMEELRAAGHAIPAIRNNSGFFASKRRSKQ